MSDTMQEPTYYKPSIPRSVLHSIQKLFDEFPDVKDRYDDKPIKFIERSILDLIDEEEQKQRLRKEYLDSQSK